MNKPSDKSSGEISCTSCRVSYPAFVKDDSVEGGNGRAEREMGIMRVGRRVCGVGTRLRQRSAAKAGTSCSCTPIFLLIRRPKLSLHTLYHFLDFCYSDPFPLLA